MKVKKRIPFYYLLPFLILLLFLAGCLVNNSKKTIPTAVNGTIDLKDWDFEKDGILSLNGKWKFKWLEDKYEFILTEYDDTHWDTLTIPGFWNNVTGSNFGYCWLRLKVLNIPQQDLAVYLRNSHRAYKLYVNEKKIMQNGKPGNSRGTTVAQRLPQFAQLPTNQDLIFAWNIANYHDLYGGAGYDIKMGKMADLKDHFWKEVAQQLFIIGIILMMCLYHLLLWIGRREDTASLYFSFFCLVIILRTVVLNNFPPLLFPDNDIYQLCTKIDFGSMPLGWFFFQLFLNQLFPSEFSKKIFRVFLIFNILAAAIIFITPSWIFMYMLIPYQISLLVACVWIIYSTVRAFRNKRKYAGIVLFGFIFIFVSIINDIIFINFAGVTISIVQIGLVMFIFAQSAVLSLRFAAAFRTAEHLSINLQNEVNKKTKQVSEQNKKLKKMHQEKTNLFINIAHETKTPLTLINNYINKFIQKHGESDEIKIIKDNLSRLTKNMVDFLDIEKIEKGKIIYDHDQIINLSNILKTKLMMFTEVARQKHIRMTSELIKGIYTKLDPLAIDRIINNLLDNAIKYTNKGGSIKVSLQYKENKIFITIEDTGIGMNKSQVKNLFKPYYQASHTKKNIQGMGIGLHIVKRIIDSVNGKITVASNPHKGTKFTIVIDKYQVTADDAIIADIDYSLPISRLSPGEIGKQDYKQDRNNIYIIEDNVDMISYLVDSMQPYYNVFYATNGKQALDKLVKIAKPDLILSDIMMDVMDGYEFYDKLQKRKKYADIPFIFLTAKSAVDERIKGLAKGAIDYIQKPFDIQELLEKINSVLNNRQAIKKSITKNIKRTVLKEVRKKIQENIAINFENNCQKYQISAREKQIIKLMFEGKLNKEICWELNITYNTIKNHIKHIYAKCNVQNKVELINVLKKTQTT